MSLFGAVADSYVSGSASFASVAAALSPTAWYRLGDLSGTTMTDSSGNSHSGTYSTGGTNPPTLGATGLLSGDTDKAVAFHGATTVGQGAVTYASWMDASTALSMFAIIKTSMTGTIMAIMDRDDGSSRVWQFRLNSGTLEFVKVSGSVVVASATGTLNNGVIHDVGISYDGSNIRLYVDGVKKSTTAAAGTLVGSSRLFIGSRADSVNLPFDGTIDEVLYKAGTVWADTDFANLHAAR